MSTLEMNTLQMNTVVNYTLNDYVTLIMTIMNYMFVHDKMTYWMENMNEKTMNTFIQVNFLMGMTLFTYSYVCFFYKDFVRGVYTTMWAFLMFYNIVMTQVKLMAKAYANTVAYSSMDDSETSDDDMEEDEEGDAFEEEVLKNQDDQVVENIVNKIVEMASQREIAEILVNEFKNAMNSVPEVAETVPEVAETVPEVVEQVPEVAETVPEVAEQVPEVAETVPEVAETVPEVVQDTVQQSEEENSVSDSPNVENTPMETEETTT